jgi:hypothetical protein
MREVGVGYRLRIERSYDEGFSIQYKVKISALPMSEFERFTEEIHHKSAIHSHENLIELLDEAFGNRNKSIEILKEAMSSGSVELRLKSLVSAELRQRFAASSE